MKRMLVFFRIVSSKLEQKIVPDTLVDEEIVRLTRRTPRTKAEQEFHAWLIQWKKRNKER